MHRKAEEEADTAVVSARTTTQRGAAWAPRRRKRPLRHDTRARTPIDAPAAEKVAGSGPPFGGLLGSRRGSVPCARSGSNHRRRLRVLLAVRRTGRRKEH